MTYDLNADGIRGQGVSQPRLYDLSNDIGESRDLAASHPAEVERLQKLWNTWSDSLSKPLWGPRSTAR